VASSRRQPAAFPGYWLDPRALEKHGADDLSDVVDALREQERAGGLGQVGRCPPARKIEKTTYSRWRWKGGCAAWPDSKSWWSAKTPNGGVVLLRRWEAGDSWDLEDFERHRPSIWAAIPLGRC